MKKKINYKKIKPKIRENIKNKKGNKKKYDKKTNTQISLRIYRSEDI